MYTSRGNHERLNRGGCPSWCIADHEDQAHPEDQWHVGQCRTVTAVELRASVNESTGFSYRLDGVDLNVLIEQHVRCGEAFVMFGMEHERHFRLSVESTRRVTDALGAALTSMHGGSSS